MDRRESFGGEALDYAFLMVSGHKQQAISKLASKEFCPLFGAPENF